MKPTQAKVLIVDDEPTQLSLLHDALSYAGYEVLAATDGPTALDIATLVVPDLILTDVDMPGMDGYEVCRRLKDDRALRDVPVIFQTARVGVKEMAMGYAAGGADYVTKPFRLYELLAAVRAQIEARSPAGTARPKLKIERLVP